jgi:hypothetical protein
MVKRENREEPWRPGDGDVPVTFDVNGRPVRVLSGRLGQQAAQGYRDNAKPISFKQLDEELEYRTPEQWLEEARIARSAVTALDTDIAECKKLADEWTAKHTDKRKAREAAQDVLNRILEKMGESIQKGG